MKKHKFFKERGVNSYDSNKYLNQDEMVKILTYAKAYGINIIPEFNSPGHTGQILWYFPEYRNEGKWTIASNPCYSLNLENVEAKNFMTALIRKYIDFFHENGCTDFCVGGDEFTAHGSSDETIAEYVNGLAEYVESKGMTAYAWVDGQSVTSGLLKESVVVNDWDSDGSAASDYRVVNFNSDYMYYVLKASGDWWLVNPKNIFETWNPLLFYGNSALDPDSDAAANVLGAIDAMKEISVLEEQLKEAGKNADTAQTAAVNAQNRLDEAEKRVTAAEKKAASAQNQMDKLTAEAELYTARAEANKNLRNAVIQAEVDINGTIYKVTQIDANAFKGLKQLKKVTIGSNIQIIQKQAFAQCSKLANINMKKAKGITSIKGKAFSKISAKAKVTVPAKKKDKYKKLLKKGGLSQKATIK